MTEHLAYYRKFRPQSFSDVVGQEAIIKTLLTASKKDHFSHAYLFTGPRGTGKTSAARLVAKAINCPTKKEGEPCNTCEECKSIQNGTHPDLIEMDAASHTSVDDMRDLIEKAQFTPSRGKKKIYIIDEAHMLSKSAFNALLKTLEEPPEHVHFILATTEPHKLPVTIVSRCQRFDFKRISDENIITQLEKIAQAENIKAEKEALELIARQTQGGMRDSIGLLEQLTEDSTLSSEKVQSSLGLTSLPILESLLSSLENKETTEAVNIINQANDNGANLSQFVKDFLDLVRQKMLALIDKNQDASFYLNIIENFRQASIQLKQSFIPQLPLEIACIKSTLEERVVEETESQKTPNPNSQSPTPPKDTKESKPQPEQAKPKESNDTWKDILKGLKTATLKVSLKEADISLDDSTLTISIPSQFNFDKINSPASKAEIATSAEKVLGKSIEIKVNKSEPELKTINPAPKPKEESITANDISEVFGS